MLLIKYIAHVKLWKLLRIWYVWYLFFFVFFHSSTFQVLDKPRSQDPGVVLSSPRFLPSFFFAHKAQQFHCSSFFSSNAANSRSRAFRKSICAHRVRTSLRICTSMHPGGLELTKLTYTGLEDNLIRHRGDRVYITYWRVLDDAHGTRTKRCCCHSLRYS